MRRILVAVDDSESAVRALRVAKELFGPDARYTAIAVSPTPEPSASADKAVVAPIGVPTVRPGALGFALRPAVDDCGHAVDLALDRAAATAAEQAKAADVVVSPIGRIGDPAHAIIAAAEAQHADVIVVGSRKRSWFRRTFGRAMSDEITRAAAGPVLVVK
jgi:nucleotide-binding universal stress UspA family protein